MIVDSANWWWNISGDALAMLGLLVGMLVIAAMSWAYSQGCREAQGFKQDAGRYRWLRDRDLETLHVGGVFAGVTPDNFVINGCDLDERIDFALAEHHLSGDQ